MIEQSEIIRRVEIINGQPVLVRVMPERIPLFPDTMNARGKVYRNRYHTGGRMPSGISPGWRIPTIEAKKP